MSTIVTRAGKGSALTHNEVDANFNNLNNDKIEAAQSVTLTNKTLSTGTAITAGTINGATIGATTPSSGAFTTLSTSSTVSGTGFSTYLASPPAIGGTAAAAGSFTTLSATGVTTVQAGTVSAPAITTSGDTNTGIFFPAADTIAFAEGGTESLRLNSSGQIAVNAAGSASTPTITKADDLNTGIFYPAADAVAIGTGGTEALRVNSSQNVGIGTSSPATKLDVSGTITATSVNTPNTFGFKNRIINGAMAINQRVSSLSTNNTQGYYVDRMWGFSGVSTAVTFSQIGSTGLAGFPNAARVQRTAANTGTNNVLTGQIVESNNLQDLQGQTVSISFWARAGANYSASASGLTVYLRTGTTADQGLIALISGWAGAVDQSTPVTLTTSWQRFTVTSFSVPSNAQELTVFFGYNPIGTAGANDWFDITGVQLEKGSTATSFDYRPYGTELQLCQRYYYQYCTASTDFQEIVTRFALTNGAINVQVPVSMRSAPTAVLGSSPFGRVVGYDSAFGVTIANVTAFIVAPSSSLNTICVNLTHASVSAANGLYGFSFDTNANPAIGLSSEL